MQLLLVLLVRQILLKAFETLRERVLFFKASSKCTSAKFRDESPKFTNIFLAFLS